MRLASCLSRSASYQFFNPGCTLPILIIRVHPTTQSPGYTFPSQIASTSDMQAHARKDFSVQRPLATNTPSPLSRHPMHLHRIPPRQALQCRLSLPRKHRRTAQTAQHSTIIRRQIVQHVQLVLTKPPRQRPNPEGDQGDNQQGESYACINFA